MIDSMLSRLRSLIRRRRVERETDDELQFHVEMEIEANRAKGLSPDAARQKALRDLGGVTQTRDAVRQVRTTWLDSLWQDIRYSARGLVRSPGYIAANIVGLGVGLTAAIVMLSVLNTVFHGSPIGIEDRDSLARVAVTFVDSRGSNYSATAQQVQEIRGTSAAITDIALMSVVKLTLKHADEIASVPGAVVSDSFFQVLRTTPAAGRLLTAADDQPGTDGVVLGFKTWQLWFGGSPAAIGEVVMIGDRPVRIVGVAPDRFSGTGRWVAGGTEPPQVWIPMSLAAELPSVATWYVPVITARLAPGATHEQALAELRARTSGMKSDEITGPQRVDVRVMDFVIGEMGENGWFVAAFVAVLMIVPALLLLLGCANVANLRLARTTARARELSVRVALGASRKQLVRLILTEAALVGAGVLVASWVGTQLLVWQIGRAFLNIPVKIDPAVVAFSVGLAAAVVGLSGLVPAWVVTGRAVASGLKQTAQAGGLSHARMRRTLVVAQVSISVLLLSLGLLLLRSFQTREEAVRDPGPVVMADLDLKSQGLDTVGATSFAAALSDRLLADARIVSVGFSEFPFLRSRTALIRVADRTPPRALYATANRVTPDWFEAIALPATTGRLFRESDGADVAVISESTARSLAPTGSPIGMEITVSGIERATQAAYHVIGIVPDGAAPTMIPQLTIGSIYVPLPSQIPLAFTVFVRAHSTDEAAGLVKPVNQAIAGAASSMPWTKVTTAADAIDERNADSLSLAFMVSSAGVVALLLSAGGLFAVMSYAVSLRTHEIGVRVALGGRSSDLAKLVLREAIQLTAFGAAIGLAISIPLAFVIRSALYGVSPLDPLALAGTIGLLLLTAVAASAAPAFRAANTSPLVALRAE